MPINYASPTPDHRADYCSRCDQRGTSAGVADLVAYADDLEARVDHLVAERDEARSERDELGALLDEVAEIAHEGTERQRTPWGAVHSIDRRLRDQAPAAYRQRLEPVEQYRTGGAL